LHQLPKGTPLRQIWSIKSFGVCGSDVLLTVYGKKVPAIGNSMSSINPVAATAAAVIKRRVKTWAWLMTSIKKLLKCAKVAFVGFLM